MSLQSPVGQYKPEVLVLAPPDAPNDGNMRSLVAQLLELGIPFELDENWRIPTEPPRDFSAYKTVFVPETERSRYEADLDAYYRNGGFLYFDKFYPVARQISREGFTSSTSAYLFTAWGRDVYFWSAANYLLEVGVTLDAPDFRRTLVQRDTATMAAELRQDVARRAQSSEPSLSWGDPTFTTLLSHLTLAKEQADAAWLADADAWLARICDGVPIVMADPIAHQELPFEGAALNCFENMAHLLLMRGSETGNTTWIDAGAQLGRYFFDNVCAAADTAAAHDRRGTVMYSGESMQALGMLFWLGRVTGEQRYTDTASQTVRKVVDLTQTPEGLWHHFVDMATGRKGAFWSRMAAWPATMLAECLVAIEPDTDLAAFMRSAAVRTLDALAAHQDNHCGLWHLLIDEPTSRIESTVAQHAIFSHDRLRRLGVIDNRYAAMADRAFVGLKQLYYDTGLAASCRGTACGVPNYYRSRPQGWCNTSMFPAALAGGR